MEPELIEFQQNLIQLCDQIYQDIGPYGPEKLYQKALSYELKQLYPNYVIVEEDSIPIYYKGQKMSSNRIDISIYKHNAGVVETFVLLELKWITSSSMEPFQLSNYMFLKNCNYGFMINFEKIGQYPTNYCAKVYDARTNLEKSYDRKKQKVGHVTINRFIGNSFDNFKEPDKEQSESELELKSKPIKKYDIFIKLGSYLDYFSKFYNES